MTDSEYVEWIVDTYRTLLFYARITIVPIGLIFNLVCILIFLRGRFRNESMGFYNVCISVVNIILLSFGFFYFGSIYQQESLVLVSNFTCRTVNYFVNLLFQLSSWLNVLTTVDRLIRIRYPKRFFTLRRRKTTLLIVLAMTSILAVLNISQWLISLHIHKLNSTMSNQSQVIIKYCIDPNVARMLVKDILFQLFRVVIPTGLIIYLNYQLGMIVLESRRKINKEKSKRKQIQFAVNIFASNVLYVLCIIPEIVTMIMYDYFMYSSLLSDRTQAYLILVNIVSIYFLSYNYACTLFTNLLFNKQFRREFRSIAFDFCRFIVNARLPSHKQNPSRNQRNTNFTLNADIIQFRSRFENRTLNSPSVNVPNF